MVLNAATRRNARRKHAMALQAVHTQPEAKKKFIDACCGDFGKQHALEAGVQLFAKVAESRMQDYENATTELMDALWNSRPRTTYLDQQLDVTSLITASIQSLTEQTTIDDIVDKLYQHYNVDMANGRRHEDAIRHLVFAGIGWSTMLYTATYDSSHMGFSTTTKKPGSSRQRIADSSKRPIGALLRNYGLIPIACPPGPGSSQSLPPLLAVTHLNFFSLSTLGDVTISWVDDIREHCEFERYSKNKALKLFRFPSFCAQICLSDKEENLLGRLSKSHTCQHNCRSRSESVAKSYMCEVLLSYRLLFGQNQRSRELYQKREKDNAKWRGTSDPLLDALCGDKDLKGFECMEDLLRERGVYNALINFPHLSAKLIELEDYSDSQRPRNWKEVWNDVRVPERMLTFQALVIVGGATIVLGFIQIMVGVAQILVSIWY